MSAEPDQPPTIFDWGGGREAFEQWLKLFYDLVEQDDLVGPVFGGTVGPEHRDHATTWWCEVMGGPAEYTETRGGYEHMLHQHIGLAITLEQRLQFVTLLSRAADESGLPADPEFRAAIIGYAEWAHGSRFTTRSPARLSPSTHRSRGGAGASPRRISRR